MKNLKLKWKLLVSYGVIFLFLVIMGVCSLSVSNMMSKKSVEYAEKTVPVVEEIGLARRNMVSVRRYLLNAMIVKDASDFQRVTDSMNTDRDALYSSLDTIESINKEYAEDVSRIRQKLESVSVYNSQIMDLASNFGNEDSIDQAYNIYLNYYAPAFDEAADMIVALNNRIDQDVVAQESMVKSAQTISKAIVILIFVLSLGAVGFFTALMLRYVLAPIQDLLKASEALARGDFANASIHYDSKDEFGEFAAKITAVVERIIFITKDLEEGLKAIADGQFNSHSRDDSQYEGEFHVLRDSVYQLIRMLNDIMCQIQTTSNEVSSGAEQVANGAQALSQGATEQASSIQELAATLGDVSHQVDENTQLISQVEKSVHETVAEVGHSTERMKEMLDAMENINTTSSEIGKIIKSIEDIAFQTNILALNAAVEAARAGTAGKGFAVVADEVRRLAASTAEASQNTADLISKALNAVQNGKSIADETAASLDRVNSIIGKLDQQAQKVATNSQAQDDAIRQTTMGVDQISAVIQNNSATAEESAAASEELSGQASILQDLVAKFAICCDANIQPGMDEPRQSAPAATVETAGVGKY